MKLLIIMEPCRFDYYEFRIRTVKNRIAYELNFMENSRLSTIEPFLSYTEYIKNRIGLDKVDPKDIHIYDDKGNLSIMQKIDKDYLIEQNDNTYSQPWKKLRQFHREHKITEYIDKLKYSKKIPKKTVTENKKYIKDKILWGLKNKCFCKNKSIIDYDQKLMIILSISCIKLNKKTQLYDVNWKK